MIDEALLQPTDVRRRRSRARQPERLSAKAGSLTIIRLHPLILEWLDAHNYQLNEVTVVSSTEVIVR